MKVIINKWDGDFQISKNVLNLYLMKKYGKLADASGKIDGHNINPCDIARNDPCLIYAFEKLERKTAPIEIIEIPDNAFWKISYGEGWETLYWSMSEIHIE